MSNDITEFCTANKETWNVRLFGVEHNHRDKNEKLVLNSFTRANPNQNLFFASHMSSTSNACKNDFLKSSNNVLCPSLSSWTVEAKYKKISMEAFLSLIDLHFPKMTGWVEPIKDISLSDHAS